MKIRYPGERIVDGLWWTTAEYDDVTRFAGAIGGCVIASTDLNYDAAKRGPTLAAWHRRHAISWRAFDRDLNYVAPRWVAWLYRWLPHHVGWYGREYDDQRPAYFLWHVAALRWHLGWLPRRRAQNYTARWFGVLRCNDRALVL